MIRLENFIKDDFKQLINEIPDARFLLQWAGPKYAYPLDDLQLTDTLAKTTGDYPLFKVYKAVQTESLEVIGHIQMMNIDYNKANCSLGRVLIFQKHRGKGYGKAMVASAVKEAFENMGIKEITLGVFDFNTTAVATYTSIGFREYQFEKAALTFQTEKWNRIKMKVVA